MVNHLVFDLDGVRRCPFGLTDDMRLREFIISVARAIDMRILHGPIICEGCADNPGPTAFAVVDLSHIALHLFTRSKKLRADIYSCKPFNPNTVQYLMDSYFPADISKITEVKRAPI